MDNTEEPLTDFEREFGVDISCLDEKDGVEFDKKHQTKRMQTDEEFRLMMDEYGRKYKERQEEKAKKKQALTEKQERKKKINELYLEFAKLKDDYKKRTTEILAEIRELKSLTK
jgi:hypothetical protein